MGRRVACKVDVLRYMRLELNQKRSEQGWIKNSESMKRGAKKLHRQFGNASKEKLKRLIRDAYGQKGIKKM